MKNPLQKLIYKGIGQRVLAKKSKRAQNATRNEKIASVHFLDNAAKMPAIAANVAATNIIPLREDVFTPFLQYNTGLFLSNFNFSSCLKNLIMLYFYYITRSLVFFNLYSVRLPYCSAE
jgi:hypothetical protein